MKATTYFAAYNQARVYRQHLVAWGEIGCIRLRPWPISLDAYCKRLERQRVKFATRVKAALDQRDALLEANARMLPILGGLYDPGEGEGNWDGLAIAMRELRAAIAKGPPA